MPPPCIVCGKADGACGDQPLAFPPITAIGEKRGANVVEETKVYLPKQNPRRGKAGYKGSSVIVVDPETGKSVGKGSSK